jgi:hypothetical protein
VARRAPSARAANFSHTAATPHRPLRLVKDVDLLLAATMAGVRMNQRLVVFEIPAWLAACERCQEA